MKRPKQRRGAPCAADMTKPPDIDPTNCIDVRRPAWVEPRFGYRLGVAMNRVDSRLLYHTGNQQHDHHDHDDTEPTGRTVAPRTAVRPRRKRTDEEKNQHDQKNSSQHINDLRWLIKTRLYTAAA